MQPTLWFDLLITGVFLTSAWYFYRAMFHGKHLAGHGFDARILEDKKSNLNGVVCTMGVGVTFVVIRAFAVGEHRDLSFWSLVHYAAVVVFVGSYLLLRTRYTGEKRQSVHRWLTYVCGASFGIALITGLWPLWLP